MAKISARGDREVARFSRPDGYTLVLTKNGRLLRRLTGTSGFNVLSTDVTRGEAEEYAERHSCREVVRRG